VVEVQVLQSIGQSWPKIEAVASFSQTAKVRDSQTALSKQWGAVVVKHIGQGQPDLHDPVPLQMSPTESHVDVVVFPSPHATLPVNVRTRGL